MLQWVSLCFAPPLGMPPVWALTLLQMLQNTRSNTISKARHRVKDRTYTTLKVFCMYPHYMQETQNVSSVAKDSQRHSIKRIDQACLPSNSFGQSTQRRGLAVFNRPMERTWCGWHKRKAECLALWWTLCLVFSPNIYPEKNFAGFWLWAWSHPCLLMVSMLLL